MLNVSWRSCDTHVTVTCSLSVGDCWTQPPLRPSQHWQEEVPSSLRPQWWAWGGHKRSRTLLYQDSDFVHTRAMQWALPCRLPWGMLCSDLWGVLHMCPLIILHPPSSPFLLPFLPSFPFLSFCSVSTSVHHSSENQPTCREGHVFLCRQGSAHDKQVLRNKYTHTHTWCTYL